MPFDPTEKPVRYRFGALFAVFFAFSAGTLTVTPEPGVNMPTTRTVTAVGLTDPLVSRPAI